MKVLSLNCGSSSVKYLLYDWVEKNIMAKGIVERVGIGGSFCIHEVGRKGKTKIRHECVDHAAAIKLIIDALTCPKYGVVRSVSDISAVGHRVVHGGEEFTESVIIDDNVLHTFKGLADLAPLHNPPNIQGIEAAQRLMPKIPHVATLDTAWHHTMSKPQYIYALPYEWYKKYGIRRYGFHGASLFYVAERAAVLLNKKTTGCNLILLHIGNGASAAAVKNGVSFDTSMGFTPLEGLVMGTRAGDHDVAIDFYVMEKEDLSTTEMKTILNNRSGLLGITGKYVDRRDILDAALRGNRRAELALQIETYRIKKYIGAYAAALGRVDALVWTGGAGEMSEVIREKTMKGLEFMGLLYDPRKNRFARSRNAEFDISAAKSGIKVFVIPTDEEIVYVEDTVALVERGHNTQTMFNYTFGHSEYRNKMRDEEFAKELKEKPAVAGALAQPFPSELLPQEAKKYAWWLKPTRRGAQHTS